MRLQQMEHASSAIQCEKREQIPERIPESFWNAKNQGTLIGTYQH